MAPSAEHIDPAVVNQIAARFRAMFKSSGIQGVVRDVQSCFDDGLSNKGAIRACMLYDIAAVSLDRQMRKVFES